MQDQLFCRAIPVPRSPPRETARAPFPGRPAVPKTEGLPARPPLRARSGTAHSGTRRARPCRLSAQGSDRVLSHLDGCVTALKLAFRCSTTACSNHAGGRSSPASLYLLFPFPAATNELCQTTALSDIKEQQIMLLRGLCPIPCSWRRSFGSIRCLPWWICGLWSYDCTLRVAAWLSDLWLRL